MRIGADRFLMRSKLKTNRYVYWGFYPRVSIPWHLEPMTRANTNAVTS
ncbi:hypothetical protein J2753_002779 [Halolamina salifodinae]|uniref:Uncharacterized protein n=1 Tax=Halolamina salifodinae TaxID=1202767 RepID=A0A8T4GZ23_9EURY|nr:hypothetical protein [Halolamina salifodinae]